MSISIIAAVDENGAIGVNGDMPWGREMRSDLRRFKELTFGCPILMGRKTYESLPNGPLPGRLNIVVTSQKGYEVPDGVMVVPNVNHGIILGVKEAEEIGAGSLFVIGGASIFKEAIGLVDTIYLTRIHHVFPDADTYFPEFPSYTWSEWRVTEEEEHPADDENKYPYSFMTFEWRSLWASTSLNKD